MEQEVFQQRLEEDRKLVEEALHQVCQGWRRYADLTEAMEYSLLAGGKRIRPVLVLETCRLCGGDPALALPLACGVEMIHTYSLIHDDLPAMDDDDLRRGRPTNHKVYGEATAILAGDGLLTAAFGVLTQAELPTERVVEAVSCLSREAGPEGMVGGQVLDMAGEGRALTRGELEQLQQLKTGALISAAAELGCIAAGGTEEQRCAVREYARCIGRAFQIQDDILDVTSTSQELGKPVHSDEKNNKVTYVTLFGVEKASEQVQKLSEQAEAVLEGLSSKNKFLTALVMEMASRRK